jgi:hypothetical protein
VLPDGPPLVRALVHNQDITLVRERLAQIHVDLPQPGAALPATLLHGAPRASTALPSRALGEAAGGTVPLDPADSSGRTAREPLFPLDLQLQVPAAAAAAAAAPMGARVLVTFSHGPSSAAEMAWRLMRQTFLRHFER